MVRTLVPPQLWNTANCLVSVAVAWASVRECHQKAPAS